MVVVLEIQVFPDNSHSRGFPKFADVSSRLHKNKNFVVLIISFMLLSLILLKACTSSSIFYFLLYQTLHISFLNLYIRLVMLIPRQSHSSIYIYSSASYFNKLLTYIPTVTNYKKKLIPMLVIDLLVCLRSVSYYRKYVKIILSTGFTVKNIFLQFTIIVFKQVIETFLK